ncbi:MAG: NADH-quinone oxidoreductase subunit M [Bacteroidota bacterium]
MSLLLILIPLIAAVFLLVARPGMGRQIALLVTLANLAVAAYAALSFSPGGETAQFQFSVPWVPSAGITFSLGMDGISLLLVILTNLLAPMIVFSSFSRNYDSESRYYGLVLMMIGALNGVFLAQDGLLFYVFYELALIPIYFICAIWGGQDRIRITTKFFIYTFIGSLFMLLSLLYVYLHTGMTTTPLVPGGNVHSFLWSDLVAVQLSPESAWWVMLGFFLAFAVKMPVFPFHTWQPDTYTNAPTGGTMLLSGIMLKMGVYGVIRWMVPLAPEALHVWSPIFMSLAVFGIVYASWIAVKQTDLKRLVAYSSIAHVGLIAAGVFAWNKAGLQGSMLQMLNHGINVVGLFFVGDLIERRLGTRSLSEMGGIAKSAPRFATLFMVVMLGSVAVPLTNGFPGEFLLLNGVWNYNVWMGAAAGLTIIFGAVYMLRAYGLAMFGEPTAETANFADLDQRELIILGVIAALVIGLGFFPQTILGLTDSSVTRILSTVQF